ncbi:MAG: DUF2167 domain-containing protein [Burkholderiales bacterium]
MSNHFGHVATVCLLACAAAVSAAPPSTSPSSVATVEAETRAMVEAVQASRKIGPAQVALRDQAKLNLASGYIWVPTPAAAQLMRSMGNSASDNLVGIVLPADGRSWIAVVKFSKEGYIKDDDAKDWNADELLDGLRKGTETQNQERAKRGFAQMELVGWAQKPLYDAGSHQLVWSVISKDKGASGSEDRDINYNTYALGREGFINLNLVTTERDLAKYKPEALKLLGALHFIDGKRYADFNASTDKVAAYGLAALVAGAAAKKLGLLAVVLAFLAKFAKVAVVAGGAALWGVAKMFKKQSPSA